MPTGVYIRTEKHKEISRRIGRKTGPQNIKIAQKVSASLARTKKQKETARKQMIEMNKRPKSVKQIQTSRENAYRISQLPKTQLQIEVSCKKLEKARKIAWKLPRSKAQIENARRLSKNFTPAADTIIKHHNDLCHGAKKPDDITPMTLSQHAKLHMKLRIENGTAPHQSKI
jgi:hypothetical protein